MAELQTLNGSEKQVSWATQIRDEKLATFDKIAANIIAQAVKEYAPSDVEKAHALLDHARSTLAAVTSAKWWIDNRVNIFHDDLPETPVKDASEVIGPINHKYIWGVRV